MTAFIARMTTMRTAMRLPSIVLLCCLVLASACASGAGKGEKLQRAQYSYSAAIRWGDFEGAWTMVDPAYREAHPMTDAEFERYKQIQVSHYRDGAVEAGKNEAARAIEIGVINRHTMAERSLRYTEHWRYDPEAKTWWVVNGLPDFWAGE